MPTICIFCHQPFPQCNLPWFDCLGKCQNFPNLARRGPCNMMHECRGREGGCLGLIWESCCQWRAVIWPEFAGDGMMSGAFAAPNLQESFLTFLFTRLEMHKFKLSFFLFFFGFWHFFEFQRCVHPPYPRATPHRRRGPVTPLAPWTCFMFILQEIFFSYVCFLFIFLLLYFLIFCYFQQGGP